MYYLNNSCKYSYIVVLVISLVVSQAQLQPRIVGGTSAEIEDFPYIISLRIYRIARCGGSIISKSHVLTAAHCVNNWKHLPQYLSVQYGVLYIIPKFQNSPNIISVKSIKVHEHYEENSPLSHDIAILELADEIYFGQNVSPVSLPDPYEDLVENSIAEVAGWGRLHDKGYMSTQLQRFSIRMLSDDNCYTLTNQYDANSHICGIVKLGWHGICDGDSGGPLVVDGKQYGIVSGSDDPCGSPGQADIFTRVSTYRKWINRWTGV